MAENGNFGGNQTRYRLPESASNDDNPDITKYMGYYRAKLGYMLGDSIFSVEGNYNWNSGYGGATFAWSYPISEHVRFTRSCSAVMVNPLLTITIARRVLASA